LWEGWSYQTKVLSVKIPQTLEEVGGFQTGCY
jgi:hypothetical protein